MFTLSPVLQSLPASRRLLILLSLPLAVAGALAWPQDEDTPYFPPVPTLAEQEWEIPPEKPSNSRKELLPRRDPFRPLNHPAPEKTLPAPAATYPGAAPHKAAPAAPVMPHRLLGILTVKGEKRALVAGPQGTTLIAPGETLPGKGLVTAFHGSSLECNGQELPVGEVWE